MNVAVSNIAWPTAYDRDVAHSLHDVGVVGVELAPTKYWPDPTTATDPQVDACRRFWEEQGLPIVAAQALLFGRADLTLFESPATRERTLHYLGGIIRVCGRLGAKALVFGSPKNRRVEGRNRTEVWTEAVDFFSQMAERATAEDTTIVLEANPVEYGTDFVTRADEALNLVRLVSHPGLRLHLDSACMTLAGDNPDVLIPTAIPFLAHYHASEPFLGEIGSGTVPHARFAAALNAAEYTGLVSIEMKQTEPFDLASLTRAVGYVRNVYL